MKIRGSFFTAAAFGLAGLLVRELLVQEQALAEPAGLPPGRPHFAERDGHRIHLWERAPRDPELATSTERVLLLVHGGTWSSRPGFDLPGASAMQALADSGWNCFGVDLLGYGDSDEPPQGEMGRASEAAKDLEAAIDFIRSEQGVQRVALLGWSFGSLVAGRVASQSPEKVSGLVLYGTRYQPLEFELEIPKGHSRVNDDAAARIDFTELHADPDLVDRFAELALETDPESPNGVFVSYQNELPILEPATLRSPTLVLVGEVEAQSALPDLTHLFEDLAPADKRLIVIPGGGHAVHLESGRERWHAAVLEFLEGAVRAD